MSKKLYNSLIEYIVVAGCNQDTGLVVYDENEVKIYSKLFNDCIIIVFYHLNKSFWSTNQTQTACI